MLTKISIQGFKSVNSIKNLELGLINVLIGANGSGKSNILEAIGMLGAAAEGRVDAKRLLERGVRHGGPALYKTSLPSANEPVIVLKSCAIWDEASAEYEVVLNNSLDSPAEAWTYEREQLWHKERNILTREHTNFKVTLAERGQSVSIGKNAPPPDGGMFASFNIRSAENATNQLNNTLSNFAIFAPATPVLRGVQPDIIPTDPIGLMGGRLAEAVEDILDSDNGTLGSLDIDEVLDLLDWVDEFDVTAPSRELLSPNVPSLRSIVRFKDYWMDRKRNQLSGYDASEGALYVLFMLVLALHPRTPKFFAIDNFDQAMNPRLVRALTRLFCRIIIESDPPRQAMLTTHNPLVLDGLDLRDNRIRLFAVERNRDTGGATKVTRVKLSDKILETGEKGTPLSMMWVMGLLGGVPGK